MRRFPMVLTVVLQALLVAVSACGGATTSARPPAASVQLSPSKLTKGDIAGLATVFADHPLAGGQAAPFLSKWVTSETFVALQFDNPDPAHATHLLYMGVGQKGVFCAEAQPDAKGGPQGTGSSFTSFHQWTGADYTKTAGGAPGAQGYWLSFLAMDSFTLGGRHLVPGIDYGYSPTKAPSCGAAAAKPSFTAPGAAALDPIAIGKLFGSFTDQPLLGGQMAPRQFKAVTDRTLAFVQFDHPTAALATQLRYFGVWESSTYCRSTQPSPDFSHFHDLTATSYALGHGGAPNTVGFWGTWIAAIPFVSSGREVSPGVDRLFSPTTPPSSC